MTRVVNFNPGPAAIALPALELAQKELLEFENTGMSILEHSHRGKAYDKVHQEAKSLLKELLAIPATHEVLFMQGGASAQFALVPMNLLPPDKSADYILTGTWSEKAFAEAQVVGKARTAGSTKKDEKYARIPEQNELELDKSAAYAHITSNNTIFGTQWHGWPETGSVPLIADMSSDILWAPIDVSKFGLIYAGAQKNVGPTGITVVIGRKDLLEKPARPGVPKIFRYGTALKEDSLYNTIPTFAVYLIRNVLRWVKEQGGLPAMQKRNREKADMLYGCIESLSSFYRAPVEKDSRSTMNIVFRLPTESLEEQFVKEATAAGLVGLKGHRSVGGIRASIYNAIGPNDVRKLVDFMTAFAKKNG